MSSSGAGTGPPGPTGATGATGPAGAAGVGTLSTVTIAGAALTTLHSAPIVVVAAPGANRVLQVLAIQREFVPGVTIVNNSVAPQDTGTICYDGSTSALNLLSAAGVIPWTASADLVDSQNTHVLDLLPYPDTVGVGGASNHNFAPALIVNKTITVAADNDGIVTGPATAITIANGGAAYIANDTGTITAPSNGNAYTEATYKVLTVGAAGIVTSIQLTSGGAGLYDTTHNARPTATGGAQAGIGTGLTVNITAATLTPDGTLYVSVVSLVGTTH